MSDLIRREDAIDAALTYIVEYCGAAFDEDMQKMLCERLDALPSAEPERTAKVESRIWRKDLTLIGGGSWSGKCQECGRWVKSNECTYYPSCGARLEW